MALNKVKKSQSWASMEVHNENRSMGKYCARMKTRSILQQKLDK